MLSHSLKLTLIALVCTTLLWGQQLAASSTSDLRKPPDTVKAKPPEWAIYTHQALGYYKTLVDYWVSHVHADDDDYFDVEGGWNDDVELAQSLTAFWFLTGDEKLRQMLIDMARKNRQAAYTGSKPVSPWYQPGDTRFVQGYHSQEVDIHHSSEEVTLVYPRLFLMDYGNPENIELMTRMVWNFEDNMGATERNWGQRVATGMLMRSPKFNGRFVDWKWADDLGGKFEPQDVPQNFRATAPGLSLAWYYGPGHYFWQEGKNGFLKNHHDAWIAASNSTAEDKPAYMPPSKILLKDLSFGHNKGWLHNNDLGGSGWAQGGVDTFRHFYHALTADWLLYKNSPSPVLRKFSQDASRIVQEAFHYRQNGWLLGGYTVDVDRAFMQWRAEVNYTADDPGLLRRKAKNATTRMTAYNVFLQHGDLRQAVREATEGLKKISNFLFEKTNLGEWTYALKSTDPNCPWTHDCLTDQVKFHASDALLMASVGGSGIYDGAYPTLYFSWADTGTDIASLMLQKNPEDLQFWVWNFGPETEAGIYLWRLTEGKGLLTIGPDENRDGRMDNVNIRQMVPSTSKGGKIQLKLPPNRLQLVRIQVTDPKPRDLSTLPDPAVAPVDLRFTGKEVQLRVHNIGLAPTGPFKIRLLNTDNKKASPDKLIALPAFQGMEPITKIVHWKIEDPSQIGSVVIDPENQLQEITTKNNVIHVQTQSKKSLPGTWIPPVH